MGKQLYIIVTLLLFSFYSQAQQKREVQTVILPESRPQADTLNLTTADYTRVELPPLHVFLDAVYSNASVKIHEAKKEEELANLKVVEREWLNYFRIQGQYQYGITNGNYTRSDVETPAFQGYSGTAQHWYNIGANLSIPLDDLFNRKNKLNAQKAKIKQTDYEYEQSVEERKLKILETYNEALKHLTILKVKSEAVALYNAQMRISETDFINGKIDIISLSLERGRRSTAVVNYEESRAALHNSITLLEMLTNVRIINQ